jgi:hypothetical protein
MAVSLVSLVGCTQEIPRPVVQPDKAVFKQAAQAFDKCVYLQAEMIDDRTSPATDIAKAASVSCSDRWQNLLDIQDAGMSPYEKMVFLSASQRNHDETKLATIIVLEERRNGAQGNHKFVPANATQSN